MTISRLQRLIRARWWVLVFVALLALWVAGRLTEFRNSLLPTEEATITITFLRQLGETSDDGVLQRLADAESLAKEVNASKLAERVHPLAPWEVAAITRDDRTRQLIFIGRGASEEQAVERVTALLDGFLSQQPFTGILGIQDQLDRLAVEITKLERQIQQATAVEPPPPPGPDELAALAELKGLDAQIGALQTRYNNLRVELLDPVLRPSVEIQAEIDDVLQRLVTLQLERRAAAEALLSNPATAGLLGAAVREPGATEATESASPFSEEDFERQIEVSFWQIQATELRNAYQELFLRKIEVDRLATIDESPVLGASTLEPVKPITNQVLALVAGLLIGLGGLIVSDRIRKPLWAAQDVEGMTQLPEVAPRSPFDPVDVPWYTATPSVPRKAGIQALRAVVEGLASEGPPVVALTGLAARRDDIQELAADLAASVAVSGSRVLVIDADLGSPTEVVEFGEAPATLAGLLMDDRGRGGGPGHTVEEYRRILADLPEVVPNMVALRAGTATDNAPDVLARPEFGLLVEAARESFDVVLVAGADSRSPITQVLSQRLDHMILVGVAGRTVEAELEAARREFADRRANLLGLVLLLWAPTRLGRLVATWLPKRPPVEERYRVEVRPPRREPPGPGPFAGDE